MPITATCSACQHRFQAPDTFAGKRVKCRHCGQVFQIPAVAGVGTPTTASSATASSATASSAGGLDLAPAVRPSFAQPSAVRPSAVHSGTDLGGSDESVELSALESVSHAELTGSQTGSAMRPGRNGSVNGGSAVGRSAAGRPAVATAPAAPPPPRGRTVDDNDAAAEDDDDGDTVATRPLGGRRPNFPIFSYPGAAMVDQGLPLTLLILGLGWLGLLVSGDDEAAGLPVIKLFRFLIPVLFYLAVIFPFVYSMICKAAFELNYNLPPTPKMRAFGAYLPAFVFAQALWIMGQGSLPGMVVGLVMGLVLSSALLFLLFRLREEEVATTVSYAAGGFAIGTVLTVLLMFGLSFVTAQVVIKDQGQKAVPISPFAIGMSWAATPPKELPPEAKLFEPHHSAPPVAVPVVPVPTPDAPPVAVTSPVVSDVHTATFPSGSGTVLLRPLSDTAVVGLLHPGAEGSTSVTAWDLANDKPVGVEIQYPTAPSTGPGTGAVVSDGGTYLAHIVTWPRRSIQFAAFATGRTVAKIDLDPQLQDPVLYGFVGADKLLVRGTIAGAPVSDLGAALGVKPGATPVVLIVNLTDPKENKTVSLPTVASTGFPMVVSTASQRLAIATHRDGVPIVAQIDLNTGQPIGTTINLDIDHSIAVSPTGFTYSTDGKRIGVLFEQAGNAALLSYDANTGSDMTELDFPAPAGIVPKAARDKFKGNALVSFNADAWVAYGNRLIDAHTGDVVAPLLVDGVTDQRLVQDGRMEFVTSALPAPPVIQIATIDPAKVHELAHGLPATSPATKP